MCEGIKTFPLCHSGSFLPIAFDTYLFPEVSLDWPGENQWLPTLSASFVLPQRGGEGVLGKELENLKSVPAL